MKIVLGKMHKRESTSPGGLKAKDDTSLLMLHVKTKQGKRELSEKKDVLKSPVGRCTMDFYNIGLWAFHNRSSLM